MEDHRNGFNDSTISTLENFNDRSTDRVIRPTKASNLPNQDYDSGVEEEIQFQKRLINPDTMENGQRLDSIKTSTEVAAASSHSANNASKSALIDLDNVATENNADGATSAKKKISLDDYSVDSSTFSQREQKTGEISPDFSAINVKENEPQTFQPIVLPKIEELPNLPPSVQVKCPSVAGGVVNKAEKTKVAVTVAKSSVKPATPKQPIKQKTVAASAPITGKTTVNVSKVAGKTSATSARDTKKIATPTSDISGRSTPKDGEKKFVASAYKNVQSKIGSFQNADHKPGGGAVKIESKKLEWQAPSKIGSLQNATHKPGGGDKKIEAKKLEWNAKPKVGSLQNATHKPGGGNVSIVDEKINISASSKVGSLENAKHQAGGGKVKIETKKLEFDKIAKPKVGSLDNASHKPAGGNVKIVEQKLNFSAKAEPKVPAHSITKSK